MEVSIYIIKSIAFKILTRLNEGKFQKKVSAQSDVIDMGYALLQSNIMSFGDEKYNSNISLTLQKPTHRTPPSVRLFELVKKKEKKPHNSKNI